MKYSCSLKEIRLHAMMQMKLDIMLKQLSTEREILYDTTHELPGIKFVGGGSRMVVFEGWEEGDEGELLNGYRVCFIT